ncbi:helix-turn-helix domain-containing protein [Paenibacillus sp. GCM10027626]|uniref:helix-turn-helix domain-containing protein n=1 Tax=Paenibacillus sp. GCM10027626 TaxID=3273411 RepID=UPI00364208B7
MQYESTIQKTIDWIEAHLHEEISDSDIVERSNFSKYHFHRIFHSSVGLSVAAYIRMRRLAAAAVTLLLTEERIIDIALYFQFESQEAFTRAFKKVYYLPPGQYRKLMSTIVTKKEETWMERDIEGWFLSGSHPFNYEMGIDREVVHQGSASGYLKSKTVQDASEFATMMQQFKAGKYKGQRIKLSCFIKTNDVQHFSGLWMRVDNAAGDTLQFDNMSNRPIVGTNTWNHYAVVLDIPEDSATISFGVLLSGLGHVWIDQFSFEKVNESVETTNLESRPVLLDEPTNLSFEENI